MNTITARGKVKSVQIRARVYRAETGKWENLGVLARTKESFMRRIIKWLQQF
jgi:hypothetical protein